MKNNLNAIITLLVVLLSFNAFSQEKGFIRGTVIDDKSGLTMIGARVTVEKPGVEGIIAGGKTDFDGKFSIEVLPDTYSIKITSISFETILINDIIVTAGKTNIIDDIFMKEASNELGPVIVTRQAIRNTENAMLKMKGSSVNVIDGISASSIRKIGDSDAAGAIKRVPGVSLAGGKYVFIRGLGDRYNKTLLNGVDIPGLDPDRNTIQMDIFPTNILDNIIVNKSFVAELPADFTGGIVDVALKSFPEEKTRSISVSTGYNPNFHFNKNYLTYDGGKLDALGFDDGTREIPATQNIPFFAQAIAGGEAQDRYQEVLSAFNPKLAAYQQRSLIDAGFSTSFGNQFKKEKVTIGYNVIASYKNSTEYYQDVEYGRYGRSGSSDVTALETRELQTGSFGVNNVLLTGMAGFAIKTEKSKYTLNLVHLQNGESKAGIFDYFNSDQGAVFNGFQHNLEYSQRALTNLLLSGKHKLHDKKWEFEWKVAPSLSSIKDPDIRFTRYEIRTDTLIIGTEAGFPERIWRDLNEKNLATKAGAIKEFKLLERKALVKFGGGYTYKQRDFIIRNFALNVRNINLTGDPDELFAPENIWPVNGDFSTGTTYETSFLPSNPNRYNSNVNNVAGYIATEFSPWRRIKTILGVRIENYTQRYTGQDQLGTNIFDNEIVLDDLGLFPSLNVVYEVTERQNLRFSYGKTTARPSFKELSFAEIYDPITGRTFIGGLFRDEDVNSGTVFWDGQLESTTIHNFDLRWEIFPAPGQTVSISAFYKNFINPIEIVQFSAQAGSFQPRNVGDGEVLGAEFELRQNLKFLGEKWENFSANLNITATQSRILFSVTEKESRVANARAGEIIGDYRNLAGQAPYLINAGLAYNGGTEKFLKGFQIGAYYNVQGQTLQFVGIVDRPDIYTVPFHSLNITGSKTFGKEDKFLVGLKIKNLLNDKQEAVFRSFGAEDQFFSRLNPGTTISARFRINF